VGVPGRIAVHERCDHGAVSLLELKEHHIVGLLPWHSAM
jgi:hypothetical protein